MVEFKLRLSKLKKVVSEIKKAFIKNDSIPIIFNEYMGQVILMRGRIATINSLVFMTRDVPIKIDPNLGIGVPDEFLQYIDKIKLKGENEYVFFRLEGNTLYLDIELKDSKISTIYTVTIFDNASSIIPEPSTSEIEQLPEKFMTAVKFCCDTVKKSKDLSPQDLVWCYDNIVFSADGRQLSKVDLGQSFSNDFSLSKRAIDIIDKVDVDSYAIDNRYAFFYSSNQVVGIRQYNFDTPKYYCECIMDYVGEYAVRIPYEIKERLPEIATMNNKKKSPNIEVIESGSLMTIMSSASSKRGVKNDIIFEANSDNEQVSGELHIGMFFEDFKNICKRSLIFSTDENQSFLNQSLGDFGEFNYYLKLHDRI